MESHEIGKWSQNELRDTKWHILFRLPNNCGLKCLGPPPNVTWVNLSVYFIHSDVFSTVWLRSNYPGLMLTPNVNWPCHSLGALTLPPFIQIYTVVGVGLKAWGATMVFTLAYPECTVMFTSPINNHKLSCLIMPFGQGDFCCLPLGHFGSKTDSHTASISLYHTQTQQSVWKIIYISCLFAHAQDNWKYCGMAPGYNTKEKGHDAKSTLQIKPCIVSSTLRMVDESLYL